MTSIMRTFGLIMIMALSAIAVLAQDSMEGKAKATDDDKNAAIPADSYLKRGNPIGDSKLVALNDALKDPTKFSGQKVLVHGVIIRSCKTEGCWAELAADKESKSVRVTMKDHSFFIPLKSAGATARVEGTFIVKTLSKAEVDHLVNEDGAKFANRNEDGSVTEVSFEATGIELKMGS